MISYEQQSLRLNGRPLALQDITSAWTVKRSLCAYAMSLKISCAVPYVMDTH